MSPVTRSTLCFFLIVIAPTRSTSSVDGQVFQTSALNENHIQSVYAEIGVVKAIE
jgi:hypothetical protein